MATSVVTSTIGVDTVANFKSWAQTLSNAFAAFGWVKSSDTGQVNWSTLSAVPSVNVPVFEIWQMADSVQISNPVFLRLDFTNYSTSHYPMLTLTLGNGSNGIGNINTVLPAGSLVYPAASASVVSYLSGGPGWFACSLWKNGGLMTFSIERSHNLAGADTAAYVTMLGVLAGQQTLLPAGQALLPAESAMLAIQTTNLSAIYGNVVYIASGYPLTPAGIGNPFLTQMSIKPQDFSPGSSIVLNRYGINRTYLVIGSTLMRWD